MKKVVLTLALLPITCIAQEVLYCSTEVAGGVNWETKEVTRFTVKRYKIWVDWAAERMRSKELFIGEDANCWSYDFHDGTRYLNCVSPMGVGLSIDKDTLSFSSSRMVQGADLSVHYGSCETF